jgi:GTPase SAR1 family protein
MQAFKNTFSLLSRFFSGGSSKPPAREVKLCVLGLDNSGKTTILKALAHEEIHNVMPT